MLVVTGDPLQGENHARAVVGNSGSYSGELTATAA